MKNHFLPDPQPPLIIKNHFLPNPPSVHDIINEQPLMHATLTVLGCVGISSPLRAPSTQDADLSLPHPLHTTATVLLTCFYFFSLLLILPE